MKKLKYVFILVTIFILFVGIPFVSASDNGIKYAHRYTRSLNNTCYWISSSASHFTSSINNAANDWSHLDNPIVMTPVSSSYATHMDIYGKPSNFWPKAGILGETRHFTSTGASINPNVGNWFYADIYLNTSKNYNVQATTAHEMGHAFGLDHWNSNPNSIMAQTEYRNASIVTVQQADNQHLNEKYR